jgi:hypothetical protein
MLIEKNLWKINFNFVKDVLTIYVNFSISLTTVSEEKKETLLSHHPS